MASSKSRRIDKLPAPSPRPVEMQVLALGMSRTGTMSMQRALQRLGYKSYHMVEAGRNRAFAYWLEGLKAKYAGEGEPFQRAEFDKLLGEYSAVTDIPCIMFADELLAAYPDAKVVLTERDVESWETSVNNTIFQLLSWRSFYWIAPLDPSHVGPYWNVLNLIVSIWTGGDFTNRARLRQTFRDHYAHIRSVVPEERLLRFERGDGYEELCRFLGKPVPAGEEYPHINQPDNIIKMHEALWRRTVEGLLWKAGGLTMGACFVAVGAVWWGVWGGCEL